MVVIKSQPIRQTSFRATHFLQIYFCFIRLMWFFNTEKYKHTKKRIIKLGRLKDISVNPRLEKMKIIVRRKAACQQFVPQTSGDCEEAVGKELSLYQWNTKWLRMIRLFIPAIVAFICKCFKWLNSKHNTRQNNSMEIATEYRTAYIASSVEKELYGDFIAHMTW